MPLPRKLFFILLVLMAFVIVGCRSETVDEDSSAVQEDRQSESQEEATENENEEADADLDDELHIAVSAQPPTLDQQMTTATVALDVTRNIFETLVTINKDFQPTPMLAESVEVSDDRKTYTFKLRQGVTFHNGKEMTSEDVLASMERWKEVSSQADLLDNPQFSAEDEYTVTLTVDTATTDVLTVLAGQGQNPAIMPKEVVESASADGITEYIGTGPFKFVEWKQDQYILLEKNPDYVPRVDEPSGYAGKKEVFYDKLYYHIVTDPSTRLAGIQTGEYDIVEGMPYDSYEQLQHLDHVNTYTYFNGTISMIYNKKEGLMSDKKMRQAINTILDNDQIMMASFSNQDFYALHPSFLNFDQVDWATDAGKEFYNQADPEKAKVMLEEAGYNGEEIRMIATRDYTHHYNAAVVVKEQLEQAGVTVNLEVFDWATLLERRDDASAWDMFFTSIAYQPTPATLLELDPSYPGWIDDPKVAESLQQIRTAESQEQAKELWEELQYYLWSDYVPSSLFGHNANLFAASTKVEDIVPFRGIVPWNIKIYK